MGSGRDKRKKSKGKTPGQGEQKTAKKTEQNESKAERRAAKGIEVSVTQQSSFPSYSCASTIWKASIHTTKAGLE